MKLKMSADGSYKGEHQGYQFKVEDCRHFYKKEKWYNEYRAITQDDLSEEYLKELDLLEKAIIDEDLALLKEKISIVKNLLKKMEG